MKPINTKKMMTAYAAYNSAAATANFYKNYKPSNLDSHDSEYYEGLSNKADKELDEAMATLKESMKDLDAVLDDVQKRCTERTITGLAILRTLYDVYVKLDISQKDMNGIFIRVDLNQQQFAKAYKYAAKSTQFNAEFKNGSWRITNIYRDDCHQSSKDKLRISLTEDAKAAIIRRISIGIF